MTVFAPWDFTLSECRRRFADPTQYTDAERDRAAELLLAQSPDHEDRAEAAKWIEFRKEASR